MAELFQCEGNIQAHDYKKVLDILKWRLKYIGVFVSHNISIYMNINSFFECEKKSILFIF